MQMSMSAGSANAGKILRVSVIGRHCDAPRLEGGLACVKGAAVTIGRNVSHGRGAETQAGGGETTENANDEPRAPSGPVHRPQPVDEDALREKGEEEVDRGRGELSGAAASASPGESRRT